MSDTKPLVPEAVEGRGRPLMRAGVAFGSRFFVLLAIGLMWLAPALFEPRFVYAAVGWDVLVVAAWLVDLWWLPKPDRLLVRRSWLAPPALSVASTVRLTLVNDSKTTVRVRVVDAIPHQIRAEAPTALMHVGPAAAAEHEYRIVPRERGRIVIGDAYVHYQSPVRMAERWARVDLGQTIVVYPNLDEAKRETVYLVRSRQIDMARRSRRIRGARHAFANLREYCEGDEPRDICWSASARRARLITRLYETERSQAIWVVLDAGRLMRTRVADVTKLDYAVNAALTLSQVAIGSGDRVGVLAYGRQIGHCLPAARGSAHLRQIMEHLAVVRAEESDADHLRAAGRLLTDQKRRSLIVWMTDLPDTAMTPEVVEAASTLMPRHLVLFVVIGQPDLDRVATRRPATAEEMYQTAAAQEVAQRRDVLLARLRARGALAIETAAKLSPTLVNAYLDVKQRGSL